MEEVEEVGLLGGGEHGGEVGNCEWGIGNGGAGRGPRRREGREGSRREKEGLTQRRQGVKGGRGSRRCAQTQREGRNHKGHGGGTGRGLARRGGAERRRRGGLAQRRQGAKSRRRGRLSPALRRACRASSFVRLGLGDCRFPFPVSSPAWRGEGRRAGFNPFRRAMQRAGLSRVAEVSRRGDTGDCHGLPGWVPCGLHCALYITVRGERGRGVSPYGSGRGRVT